MRDERFPKPEEEAKEEEEVVVKKWYELKYDCRATPVNTNQNDQKVLVNHKMMSISIKKDLIQGILQIVNSKVCKDKELNAAIMDVAVQIGEFAVEDIYRTLGAKTDILMFKNY